MTSDFTRIAQAEYVQYTGSYRFYDKNQKLIIDTNDIIKVIDQAYNHIFNIALQNPPSEKNNQINNVINSLVFPEKSNDSLEYVDYKIIKISNKNCEPDILCNCNIEEEKNLSNNEINEVKIDISTLKQFILFGCSICLQIKNLQKIIIYIFADFKDKLFSLGNENLNLSEDEYGVVKRILDNNVEIYLVDLCKISELLIAEKNIIIRGKKILESGRDILKFLTLRKFAFISFQEYIVPRNINLYKNDYVRNMMMFLNNLSGFTKSKIQLDIDSYRDNYYDNYQIGVKKGKLIIYYNCFIKGVTDDFLKDKGIKVEENIVRKVWAEKSSTNVNNKKYEDFIIFLNKMNVKVIEDDED